MNSLASAVQHASQCLHSEYAEHDVVYYTARPSSNGATVFLSCHAGNRETATGNARQWRNSTIPSLYARAYILKTNFTAKYWEERNLHGKFFLCRYDWS